MPCLAITFGQAPHAAHRVLSQFATMASRTRIAGRLAGLDFNTFSARVLPTPTMRPRRRHAIRFDRLALVFACLAFWVLVFCAGRV